MSILNERITTASTHTGNSTALHCQQVMRSVNTKTKGCSNMKQWYEELFVNYGTAYNLRHINSETNRGVFVTTNKNVNSTANKNVNSVVTNSNVNRNVNLNTNRTVVNQNSNLNQNSVTTNINTNTNAVINVNRP
jgi:hypothetical protein